MPDPETIKEAVLEHYGARAREHIAKDEVAAEQDTERSCCGPATGREQATTASRLYFMGDIADLPDSVTDMSMGCGNPTAIAELRPGEVVVDLGSGGGIDCFLAAKQVGNQGKVIGIDMSPDMLLLARKNARKMNATNVDFRLGEMEHLPVESNSVDSIISNCVINLAPDKDAVFAEAYRVLKPGGRLCVSDIVANGELSPEVRGSLERWAGCTAGALEREDYLAKLRAAGFMMVEVTSLTSLDSPRMGEKLRGSISSATIKAVKP